MTRRSMSDSLRTASIASLVTVVAMLLFARPAIRDAWASGGPLLTLTTMLAVGLFVWLVVFCARWFGVYRTKEEWDALKAAGEYRKEDESRRALAIVGFGLGVAIAVGAMLFAYDCLFNGMCSL
jgi:hypothetical protein